MRFHPAFLILLTIPSFKIKHAEKIPLFFFYSLQMVDTKTIFYDRHTPQAGTFPNTWLKGVVMERFVKQCVKKVR
jgi:hypothetical protein